jgi:hypothetical protein
MLKETERQLVRTKRPPAVPEGDAELQLSLPLQIDFAALNRDFEDALKGSVGHGFGIQKAKPPLFHRKLLKMAADKPHHDVYFFGCADGNAKFRIFKFS